MRVELAYGRTGLVVDLPDRNVTVVEPKFVPGEQDQRGAVQQALKNSLGCAPLRELVNSDDQVAIVFSDITRPVPNHIILPAILEELTHLPKENIVLINALGMHRANTREELIGMLGQDIVDQYRIVQSLADERESYALAGTLPDGHEVYLRKEYLDASVRILTGFIEPHFFAGFSGGPKSVAPGIASRDTVMYIHSAELIGHPKSTWGILEGNPVQEAIARIAALNEVHFVVNVALNKNKEITKVWAGTLEDVHRLGTQFVKETSMCPVEDYFDVVLTSNSGYPLDLNLYQAVKGMSAAARVVKPGGHIICVAECWDGIPEHGNFKKLLAGAKSWEDILTQVYTPGFALTDQWQAQTLAMILRRAKVHMYSDCLTAEQIRLAHLEPVQSVEEVIEKILAEKPEATICVLPEGPQTIPYVVGEE